MKLGVMQPYFFPYIGYWQLLNAVDKYVIFDDVNYIKRGWVNRNRIISQGCVKYFNIYLKAASQNKRINEISINDEGLNDNNVRIIEAAYHRAPYFNEAFPVIKMVLNQDEKNLAKYNGYLIKTICNYLGIETELSFSSEIDKEAELKGQEKIMAICKSLSATDYINAIGGQELYDSKFFYMEGISLHFLKTNEIRYKQSDEHFYENLSIIDVMMFNSKQKIRELLEDYELLEGSHV